MEHKGHVLNPLFGLIAGVVKFLTAIALPNDFWQAFNGALITGTAVTVISFFVNLLLKKIFRKRKN